MAVPSDTVADMLTRVRNAARARHKTVTIRRSKLCAGIADVLRREGYINGFDSIDDTGQGGIRIELKYGDRGEDVLQDVQRVSRPGRRVYNGVQDLPRIMDGLGICIVSTPIGVLSDRECRRKKVGGEVLCKVW